MADEPYNIDPNVSSLCSTGLSAHVLTGVILRLLTRHFSTPKGIQDPQLKDFIWNRDPRVSKILIIPVWRWLTLGAEARPAVVIKRNALRPRQLGIADGDAVVGGLDTGRVPAERPVSMQVAVTGSHTIFALASLPAQAELLGTEVATRLIQYQQAIQEEFMFNRFRVAEIGALSKVEEASEYFAVPVTVAYSYVEAWSVWSTAPFLKRITLKTNA